MRPEIKDKLMPRTLRITQPVEVARADQEHAASEGVLRTLQVDESRPEPEPLDEAPAEDASSRTGQVSEGGLDLVRNVAKRLGWTPKEEWKRDPSQWRDAPEFLEETPRHIESLQERLRRQGQAAEAIIEDERRRAREDAEAAVRAAAEAQDPVAAADAAKKLAANSGPSPQAQAWVGSRTWFNADPDARQLAVSTVNRAAAAGLNEADQLEAADMAVKKRFPEYYEDAPKPAPERQAPREEVRLSEARRAPPQVQAGTRTTTTAPKERGFAEIPGEDRRLYERYFERKFVNRGLTAEQAKTAYAKTYWAEKAE